MSKVRDGGEVEAKLLPLELDWQGSGPWLGGERAAGLTLGTAVHCRGDQLAELGDDDRGERHVLVDVLVACCA